MIIANLLESRPPILTRIRSSPSYFTLPSDSAIGSGVTRAGTASDSTTAVPELLYPGTIASEGILLKKMPHYAHHRGHVNSGTNLAKPHALDHIELTRNCRQIPHLSPLRLWSHRSPRRCEPTHKTDCVLRFSAQARAVRWEAAPDCAYSVPAPRPMPSSEPLQIPAARWELFGRKTGRLRVNPNSRTGS